jgi:hypothetical protein
MISKTTILFSTKYEEILKTSDYEDSIILVDIIVLCLRKVQSKLKCKTKNEF